MPDTPAPAAVIRPTKYTVTLLPEDHEGYRAFLIFVEQLDRYGWTVHDGHSCYGRDGTWDRGGKSVYGRDEAWTAAHRFDRDTALQLARDAAPTVMVNGITAMQAYARTQAAGGAR